MNVNQFPSIEQMTSQIGKVNNNTNTLQQNQNNLNKNGISFIASINVSSIISNIFISFLKLQI